MSARSPGAYRVLSSSVARLRGRGIHKIMITSSGPGEGKTTITAALGQSFARFARMRIVLVDGDAFRPALHTQFRTAREPGLGDLVEDVYNADLNRESSTEFGAGDWIELIHAQDRTGRLDVTEDNIAFSLIFEQGRLVNLFESRQERRRDDVAPDAPYAGGRPPADGRAPSADLLTQLRTCLDRMSTLRRPRCRFSEMANGYPEGEAVGLPDGGIATDVTPALLGMLGKRLKQPYLSRQVPAYLKDSPVDNVKLLTCGGRLLDLSDSSSSDGFLALMDHLGRSFDLVLLDSPPIALGTQTLALAPFMDGVLLVVKADGFDVSVIQRAKDLVVRSGANLLGVILNQVDLLNGETSPYYSGSYSDPPTPPCD